VLFADAVFVRVFILHVNYLTYSLARKQFQIPLISLTSRSACGTRKTSGRVAIIKTLLYSSYYIQILSFIDKIHKEILSYLNFMSVKKL
jgi:hypothetical protein